MTRLSIISFIIAATILSVGAFVPSTPRNLLSFTTASKSSPKVELNMGFGIDPERKKITRDSEPEDYFATNLDKMSDGDKLPIALAGMAFIALPFIAGLIALYAAK